MSQVYERMDAMQRKLWKAFFRQPSEETFQPIYDQSRALVYTLCYRVLRNEEDAKDAFQGVYCRLLALARKPDGAGEREEVENLLYRLAVREADSLRKRRKRRRRREVPVESFPMQDTRPAPDEVAASRELRGRLESLVATLPKRYALPLELHYFHGQSYAEISRILGKPVGTVSVYISRALKKLDPLARRARLGRVVALLGGLGTVELISPPSKLSAATVFSAAQATLVVGGVNASAASVFAGATSVLAIMKMKTVVLSALVALGALVLITVSVMQAEKARPPVAALPGLQPATPEPESTAPVAADAAPSTAREAARESPAAAPDPGPALRGVVRDAESGDPIPGAALRYGKGVLLERDKTDDAGTFRLELASGHYTLAASTAEHVLQTRQVEVAAGGETQVEFELERGAEVDVLVLDQDGRPIEGARVHGQPDIQRQRTDAEGRARAAGVSRRERAHKLYAAKDGYGYAGAFYPEFEPGEAIGNITIVLKSKDIVQVVFVGKVTDANGKPVPDARVVWGQGHYLSYRTTKQGALSGDDETVTAKDGVYRLEAHSAADYNQLSVLAEGFAPAWEASPPRGTLEKPGVKDFQLTTGHWIVGVVVDEEGEPLEDAMVMPYSKNRMGQNFVTPMQGRQRTDAEGRFRFENLPGPRVVLEVRGPGATSPDHNGWTLFKESFPLDHEVQIILKARGVIPLVVVEEGSGKPIPRFLVRYDGSYHNDWAVGTSVDREDGRLVLSNLKQGKEYRLQIEAMGYLPARLTGLVAKARGDSEELLVVLSQGTPLEGLLFDASTKAPVANADVLYGVPGSVPYPSWLNRLGKESSLRTALEDSQKVQSEADGFFLLREGEKPGVILVRAEGYEQLILRPADRDQHLLGGKLRIGLASGATVSGTYFLRGLPQPDAWVYLRRWDKNEQSLGHRFTDAEGRYGWDGLAAGTYRLYAITEKGPNHHNARLERYFQLEPQEKKTADLGGDMGPLSLSGFVRDGAEPVQQAKVVLRPQFKWDYMALETFTDSDGRFRLGGLPAGAYEASVVKFIPNFRSLKEKLEVSATGEHDFVFTGVHRITARVQFAPRTPDALRSGFTHARLQALTGDALKRDEEGARCELQGDALEFTGRFQGRYSLSVIRDEGENKVSVALPQHFLVDNLGGDQDLGVLQVPALGSLELRLHLASQGGPKPRHLSLLFDEGGAARTINYISLNRFQKVTLFEGVRAGMFTLRVMAPAFRAQPSTPTITILPGQVATVEFKLIPSGLIVGFAVDAVIPQRPVTLRRITLSGEGVRRVLVESRPGLAVGGVRGYSEDFLRMSHFAFTNLKEGTYQITLEAEDYESQTISQDVSPGVFELGIWPVALTPVSE